MNVQRLCSLILPLIACACAGLPAGRGSSNAESAKPLSWMTEAAGPGEGNGPAVSNQVPQLSRLVAAADTQLHKVVVEYDVADVDDDTLSISMHLVNNRTAFAVTQKVEGAVGFSVVAGRKKRITWHYPDTIDNIYDYQVRLTADDQRPVSVCALADQVDSNRIRAILERIEGVRHDRVGKAHKERVMQLVEEAFLSHRLAALREQFSVPSVPGGVASGKVPVANARPTSGINLIGYLRGRSPQAKTFILGAHYDTVEESPGADDNGSGIAGMLEAMHILSAYDFEHSLLFVGFDLEESDLLGSRAFVQNCRKNNVRIGGFINYDMIGCYSDRPYSQSFPGGFDALFPKVYRAVEANQFRGDFAISTTNHASAALGRLLDSCASACVPALKMANLVVPGKGEMVDDLRRSDHAPFWDNDYQALFLGDGANTRNLDYHSADDRVESLNFVQLGNVVKATIATLAVLAEIRPGASATGAIVPAPTGRGKR